MSSSSAGSTSVSRFIEAEPSTVFAAFMTAESLVEWLPPGEMTARLHRFDPHVGGGYSMSLYYPASDGAPGKTEAQEDRVEVRYVEIARPYRIVEAVTFVSDDPVFGGEMLHTIAISDVAGGCEVTLSFDNLPTGVEAADSEEGSRQSLENLATWLGSHPPD